MSIEVRDFSDYVLSPDLNVYELAGGVIPSLAEEVGIALGDDPAKADLQLLMQQVGPNKEMRTNPELEIGLERAAELVTQSGVQKPLNRSLWSPEHSIEAYPVIAGVMQMGVANWSDRMETILAGLPVGVPLHVVAGNRSMGTPTELANPNIKHIVDAFGKPPKENQYAASVTVPGLVRRGRDALASPYETGNGDVLFERFLADNPELLQGRVALGRVANAGIVNAVQLRDAARKHPDGGNFDADPENPQIIVVTDGFEIAETPGQAKDAARFQNPKTAIRQVVLTGLKLHLASRSITD